MAAAPEMSSSPLELRSSVLDAAVSLGLRSSTMRKWMLDPDGGALEEESGDAELSTTPDLISPSSSRSTTSHSTSEESTSASASPHVIRQPGPGLSLVFPSVGGLDKVVEQPVRPRFRGAASGYDSDGGVGVNTGGRSFEFLSGEKISRTPVGKKSLRWGRSSPSAADEGEESDGGYLSEAVSKKSKSKSAARATRKIRKARPPAVRAGGEDAGALLAAVNASLAFVPGAADDLDGYATDVAVSGSTSAFKRGRTKKGKAKTPTLVPAPASASASRAPTPSFDADVDNGNSGRASPSPVVRKKSSFFRGMMSRSASKDRGEREDGDAAAPAPPVPPMPSMPPMPLPIAERFARGASPIPPVPVPVPAPARSTSSTPTPTSTPPLSRTTSHDTPRSSPLPLARTVSPLGLTLTVAIPVSGAATSGTSGTSGISGAEGGPSAFKMPGPGPGNGNGNGNAGAGPAIVRAASLDIVRTWSPIDSGRGRGRERGAGAGSGVVGARRSEDTERPEAGKSHSKGKSSKSKNSSKTDTVNPVELSTSTSSSTTPETARKGGRDLFGLVKTRMKMRASPAQQAPKVSTAAISAPNSAVTAMQPVRSASASEIAERIMHAKSASGESQSRTTGLGGAEATRAGSPYLTTPNSYVFVDRDASTPSPSPNPNLNANGLAVEDTVVPSSAFVVPSPGIWPVLTTQTQGRRQDDAPHFSPPMFMLDGDADADVTPTSSRAGTPDFRRRDPRASVLAYYAIPPQPEAPSGPLPAPPPPPLSRLSPTMRSPRAELLAPMAHPYASGLPLSPRSRSPSPSPTPGLGFSPQNSNSDTGTGPSGAGAMGLFSQPIPTVRRGRVSPFPARPVLPPQDSRELVERVERYKALYAAEQARSADGHADLDPLDGDGFAYEEHADLFYRPDPEFEGDGDADADGEGGVDKHSSAYIRAARARGEKRVYFASGVDMREVDALRDIDEELEFGVSIAAEGEDVGVGAYRAPARASSWYSRDAISAAYQDFHTLARSEPGPKPGQPAVRGRESLDVPARATPTSEGATDRRSFTSASVYSRYSLLDAEKSATLRSAFLKRIEAMYGNEGADADADMDVDADANVDVMPAVPAVPALPASLRVGVASPRSRSGLTGERAGSLRVGGLSRF